MVTEPRVDVGTEPRVVLRRHWWTRLSSAHILIFSAGALAFAANVALLRPPADPPSVVVATADLLPGTVFDPSVHGRPVPMDTDGETLASLIDPEEAVRLEGSIVRRLVSAGSPLTSDALIAPTGSEGRRLMSLPVDIANAAGGSIDVGDLVDVVAVDNGVASYVITGAEVVRIPVQRRDSVSVSGRYFLVLAVDADQVLEVSAALESSSVHVVRSTGAAAPGRLRYRWEGGA